MSNTVTHELIIKLANLNIKLNSKNEYSNVKLIFEGIEDERDLIIDNIMIDKDVYSFCESQSNKMNNYYRAYSNNICFIDIVDKIVRILLKNFKLYPDIINPKGYLLSYCFLQAFGTFKNRIWAYFKRYSSHFEEMKGHVSIDKIIDNESYSDMQDYFESNKFDLNFRQSIIDSKDHRSRRNSIKKKFDDNDEAINIDDFDEENEETWYAEDDNGILLDSESRPTIKNTVITSFDVPYQTLRLDKKFILLSTEEYNEKINRIRKTRIKKWNIYKYESSMLPHDVTRYEMGINYLKVRNKKNPVYIQVICIPKKFNFNYLFFDKKAESYLKNIIVRKLTKRQQLLIGYLYYEMLSVDEIINTMNFANKTSLDKEKHRSLKILRLQILKDYDYIQNEYGETYLAYWTRMIKHKVDRIAKKDRKLLSI